MFEKLINAFNLGTSTAEKDPLLPSAQIRTQEFYDLWQYDRIDIVRGIKGAGKTALYRVFKLLEEDLSKRNLFCIFGVEATGDPVFRQFRQYFSSFSSMEFENFWTLYFLTLIRDKINKDVRLRNMLTNVEEAEALEKLWQKLKIPFDKEGRGLFGIVSSIVKKFPIKKMDAGVAVTSRPDGSVTYRPEMGVEFDVDKNLSSHPAYIGDIRDVLCSLLQKNKFRIWIMLDRLDEVFQRRSAEEENGLKGLLKASYNLSQPELRIKVFLRDDIIEQLATSKDGFTAMTHVTDRASSTMRWTKDNILLLIVKRLYAIHSIAEVFPVDQEKLDRDPSYREECFYSVFPPRVGKLLTLDWIMNVLSDGKGIVTPRDVIDLFNLAKAIEFKDFQLNKSNRDFLVSPESLKNALEHLSKEKRDKFLMAEFPHMRDDILKLEGNYSIHNAQSLEHLFNTNWNKVVADFISIGLLKHDPKKASYKIPKIWLKGLRITQGKAE